MKAQAEVEEANPSSPWLWRADWANRKAESQRKKSEIAAWVVCIFCNMVMIPVAVSIIPQLARQNDPRVFLVLGFGLIGVILFVVALRATLRRQRFGDTYFEFYSLPFSPGGRLAGRIHLKLDSNAAHGIDLRLSCVRNMITGSGDNRSTSQTVLWQTEQNVPFGAIGMEPLGRTIPVDFAIPPDAYVTDRDHPSDQVLWLLHAQADIPGINYADDFELPVFKTSSAAEQTCAYSSSEAFGSAAGSISEADAASARRRDGILLSGFSHSLPRVISASLYRHLDRCGLFSIPFERTLVFSGCVRFLRSTVDLRGVSRGAGDFSHSRR